MGQINKHDEFCEQIVCNNCQDSFCFCATRQFYRDSEDDHEYPQIAIALFLLDTYGMGNVYELEKMHKGFMALDNEIRKN